MCNEFKNSKFLVSALREICRQSFIEEKFHSIFFKMCKKKVMMWIDREERKKIVNWLACYIECCDCFQLTSIAIPILRDFKHKFFFRRSLRQFFLFQWKFSFLFFSSLSTVFSPAEQHTFWFIFQRLFFLFSNCYFFLPSLLAMIFCYFFFGIIDHIHTFLLPLYQLCSFFFVCKLRKVV